MKKQESITVVLAEEFALIREGLAAICESQQRYRVVAQCADGNAAERLIASHTPDIAVLNINLPVLYGMEVIRKVNKSHSKTKLVVVSDRRDRKTVLEVLRCGANAFLLKTDHARDLLEAFERVMTGGIYISPLLELSQVFVARSRSRPKDALESLSAREHQVFSLLIDGLRAKEIAGRLDLSPKTVDTYRSSLMRKLEIYDVAGLVKFAIKKNLTSTR